MSLAEHLKAMSATIQQAVVMAQKDEPDMAALVTHMDKIGEQIEKLKDWKQEELGEQRELYLSMQSNLEMLEHLLNDKTRNLQDAIGQASKRMQAHRKYSEADR